jgi:hypothetical protein
MRSQFTINYTTVPHYSPGVLSYQAGDSIEAGEFLMHLLAAGARIKQIQHKGAELTTSRFNKMLKVAAEKNASGMLCESLALDAAEIKHRFGFAA